MVTPYSADLWRTKTVFAVIGQLSLGLIISLVSQGFLHHVNYTVYHTRVGHTQFSFEIFQQVGLSSLPLAIMGHGALLSAEAISQSELIPV